MGKADVGTKEQTKVITDNIKGNLARDKIKFFIMEFLPAMQPLTGDFSLK